MENPTPEYQLASRVAMSQLKKPRVMPVDMSGSDFLPLSQLVGPGIDITRGLHWFGPLDSPNFEPRGLEFAEYLNFYES